MTLIRRVSHVLPFALIAGVALIPAGCGGGDGVKSYDVPKSSEASKPEPDATGPIEAMPGEFRILGAMFPADKPEWFFKLVGPTEGLAPHDAGFQKLLASVSLPAGGGAPDFATPEGWKRGPNTEGIVVASVQTPDGKYTMTVASAIGGVQANLKRWAVDQLGNATFTAADMAKYTRAVEAKGVKGLRADLRGPKSPPPPGKGGPMMGKQ